MTDMDRWPENPPAKPRFCVDCRWHMQPEDSPVHYCSHEWRSLITGELLSDINFCDTVRNSPMFCGPDGKLWEAKP